MITLLLVKIIGVYMLVGSVSGLLYPGRMKRAMDDILGKSTFLPYIGGAFALVAGLLIVLVHNVWNDLTTSIISLIGWIAVVEGFAILLLPEDTLKKFMRSMNSKSFVTAFSVAGIVVGAYLVYVGFFA